MDVISFQNGARLLCSNPFHLDYAAEREAAELPVRGTGVSEWVSWWERGVSAMGEAGFPPAFVNEHGPWVALCVGAVERQQSGEACWKTLGELTRRLAVPEDALELAARAKAVCGALESTAGRSLAMRIVRRDAWAAAFGESLDRVRDLEDLLLRTPVLITGETGTGKELIASAIALAQPGRWERARGRWETGAYQPLHLGSVPATLVPAELFGYEKGAHSQATESKDGLLVKCHGGTVFLDEIAELPPSTQVALLRCLQEGRVRPLGASEHREAAPRLLSATHEDLDELVEAGRFRADLLQRLRSVEIQIPPLRERLGDLDDLIVKLLSTEVPSRLRGELRDRVKAALKGELAGYRWPGNVRELGAAIRSISLGLPPRLGGRQRHQPSDRGEPPTPAGVAPPPGYNELRAPLKEVRRWYACLVAEACATKTEASSRLGITRQTLRSLLRESRNG